MVPNLIWILWFQLLWVAILVFGRLWQSVTKRRNAWQIICEGLRCVHITLVQRQRMCCTVERLRTLLASVVTKSGLARVTCSFVVLVGCYTM